MPGSQSPTHFQQPSLQQSYLLRLWREDVEAPWRITVQGVDADSPIHFQELSQLLDFLQEIVQEPSSR